MIIKNNKRVNKKYKGEDVIQRRYKGTDKIYEYLPEGYIECKYLESTGTQYIDTGLITSTTMGIDIDYSFQIIDSNTYAGISGVYQGNTPRTDALFVTSSSGRTNSAICLISRGAVLNTGVIPVANIKYNAKINWLNDGKLNYNNGAQIANNGTNNIVQRKLIIFARESMTSQTYAIAKVKIYSCKVSDNNKIVRYFVPCLDNTGTPCMYDIITKTPYYNVGTGDFIYQVAGIPNGYKRCKYLESTGTQYIDTGIIATENTGLNINYSYNQVDAATNAGICGIYQGNEPRTDTLFISTDSGRTNSSIYYFSRGTKLFTGVVPTVNTKYNAKINWLNNNKIIFNNTNSVDNGTNGVVSRKIILFGRDSGGNYALTKVRIYSCKFSENNHVSHHFIPCLDDNDISCLYDRVTKRTYYNQGTGTFNYELVA